MEKLTEVLAMGGYGVFVWPAFGVAVVIMLAMALASRLALKKAEAALAALTENAQHAHEA